MILVKVVVLGATGAGKSVFEAECEKQGLIRVISTTTRGIRVGESVDAYHFVSKEEFKNKIESNEMLEYELYRGNYYGVAKADIDSVNSYVMVLEPKGFYSLREIYGKDVFCVFLQVSEEERLRRAKLRGDSLEEIGKRKEEDAVLYPESLLNDVDIVLTDVKLEEIPTIVKSYMSKWKGCD